MNIKDVISIIEKSEAAVFTTINEDGFPESRALLNLCNKKKYSKLVGKSIEIEEDKINLYFTTNTSSRKIEQLRKNSKVSMYFCIPEKFKGAGLYGNAVEVTDLELKKSFWQPTWFMYYSKGPQDPDYTLLKFTSSDIRCWSNLNKHVFTSKEIANK